LHSASPEAAARNEDFWFHVRQAFSVDSRTVALNAGANNAMPRAALESFLQSVEFVNASPLRHQYDVMAPHRAALRSRIARMVNCSPEEIAITRNTTEGLNSVIFGLRLQRGDEVLTTDQDYPSILSAWRQRARRDGIELNAISLPTPPRAPGDLVEAVERALSPRTRVIQVSHIVDPTGQIFPARQIAEIARARGIQLIVDGALSFGVIPVDLGTMGCDYYATSLHKGMHAPLGTGFLYVRRERIAGLWPLFGVEKPDEADIRKFERVGTQPFYQFPAIQAALDFHEAIGTERVAARLRYLKRRWADRLAALPKVRFNTPLDPEHSCAIVNVDLQGIEPRALYAYLRERHRITCWPIERASFRGLWVAPFLYSRPQEMDHFAEVMSGIAREGIPQ
jgi:selenocysteine lyase/cysteine desulfurase